MLICSRNTLAVTCRHHASPGIRASSCPVKPTHKINLHTLIPIALCSWCYWIPQTIGRGLKSKPNIRLPSFYWGSEGRLAVSWGPLKIKRVIFQGAVYICANTKRKDEGSAREEDVTKKWKRTICKTKEMYHLQRARGVSMMGNWKCIMRGQGQRGEARHSGRLAEAPYMRRSCLCLTRAASQRSHWLKRSWFSFILESTPSTCYINAY